MCFPLSRCGKYFASFFPQKTISAAFIILSARKVMLSGSPFPTLTRYNPGVLTVLFFITPGMSEAHWATEESIRKVVTKIASQAGKETQKADLLKFVENIRFIDKLITSPIFIVKLRK